MKRITIVVLFVAVLLSGGCVDIDWKDQAERFFANLIETTMTVAISEYGDAKMAAVAWTIKYLEQPKFDWAKPVLKWVDYEELIEHAYDRLWKEWFGMLRKADYNTDAFIRHESKVFAIMDEGVVCEGLQDELLDMME